jgi:hypothetical protein
VQKPPSPEEASWAPWQVPWQAKTVASLAPASVFERDLLGRKTSSHGGIKNIRD